MLDGCWGHIVTLFISPMLHRFFNVVNIGTSLNVTDGFKVNDLADEFIHNKKKKSSVYYTSIRTGHLTRIHLQIHC